MSYLKKYEYVIAVATYGGISQAAEHLGISQPTFSKYLKKLEAELGLELFDRSALPLKLTAAGECFVEAGRRFLDLDRQLSKQLSEIKNESEAVVRVGVSPSRSPYVMPDIVEAFKRVCPEARIVIEERTTAELNRRLTEGELDLIISIYDEGTAGFEHKELSREEILLAVRAEDSAATDSYEDVLRYHPGISVGKGQAMWQVMCGITDELKLPKAEIECQSIESALALVKRGLGVMVVPSYIAKSHAEIRFLPVNAKAAKSAERRVCLFWRREQFLTDAEKKFIECTVNVTKC